MLGMELWFMGAVIVMKLIAWYIGVQRDAIQNRELVEVLVRQTKNSRNEQGPI